MAIRWHALALALATVACGASAGSVAAPSKSPASSIVRGVGFSKPTDAGAVGTRCYCVDALATTDLADPVLEWSGPRPPRREGEMLLVTALAVESCAVAAGVGAPAFDRAERHGADVVVDLTWRGYAVPGSAWPSPRDDNAAFIPAPKEGGRITLRLHDRWMGGKPDEVEECPAALHRRGG